MLLTERLLEALQGAPIKRFSLAEKPLGLVHERQIINAVESVGMPFGKRTFSEPESFLGYCGRLLIFALAVELDNLLIEGGCFRAAQTARHSRRCRRRLRCRRLRCRRWSVHREVPRCLHATTVHTIYAIR